MKWYKGEPKKTGAYITVQEYVDNFERHRFISCAYWQVKTVEKELSDDGSTIVKEVGFWIFKEKTSYIVAWAPISEIGIEVPNKI